MSAGDQDWLGLRDRVCVITGAASGIGRETALTLARTGCFIVVASPEVENNEKVAGEIRAGDAIMVKGSLGSRMAPIVKALQRAYPRHETLEGASVQG